MKRETIWTQGQPAIDLPDGHYRFVFRGPQPVMLAALQLLDDWHSDHDTLSVGNYAMKLDAIEYVPYTDGTADITLDGYFRGFWIELIAHLLGPIGVAVLLSVRMLVRIEKVIDAAAPSELALSGLLIAGVVTAVVLLAGSGKHLLR
jgi:hypothetical protein